MPFIFLVLLCILSCGAVTGEGKAPLKIGPGVFAFLNLHESFFITENDAGVVNEEGDQFGSTVFPGDLNGDGFEDVVVGAPDKAQGSGAVYAFFGSEAGATIGGLSITQADAGEVGVPGDRFGATLGSGDFNGDKIEDLVVSAPGKAPNGGPRSGAVFIFLGTADGFAPGFLLTQTDAGELNEEGDEFGAALATGDFDGNGLDELVVGAPGKALDGGPRSGVVYIFSGAEGGFLPGFTLTQSQAGGMNEEGDRFGATLESAHFNGNLGVDIGDGFGDLAVGAPGETINGQSRAGAVFVYLGSKSGFSPGFIVTQTDAQGAADCNPAIPFSCTPEVNEAGDEFGAALGVGDLNGDGVEELIIGAPGEAIGNGPRAGTVFIYPGSPTITKGLTTGYYLTQRHAGGVNTAGDRFGAAIASGVLNQDDREELCIGAPGKTLGPAVASGAVYVFPGVDGNTGSTMGFMITQADAGGVSQAGDRFGTSVAIEDFNDNNGADLAVGAPGDVPRSGPNFEARSGAAFIFTGVPISPPAITPKNACTKLNGIPVRPCEFNEPGDLFGAAIGNGDFNADGFADLVVGAPGKAPGSDPRSGAVFIFPGSTTPTGISTGFFITQNHAGQVNEAGDLFGTALAIGDFDADGFVDLAVGAPGKDAGGGTGSGVVFIFPGSPKGLTCLPRFACPTSFITGFSITQVNAGGMNEAGDQFGAALVAGHFDDDGIEDLAVGAPGDGTEALKAGSVYVFPGSAIGITTGYLVTQADAGEVNEDGDRFGEVLAAGDIVGDVKQDLIIGAPQKGPGSDPKSGSVFIFPGSAAGITTGILLSQTAAGETNEAGDQFGAALIVGDFDGDRIRDLAVGAPGDAPDSVNTGSVFIFPGSAAGITTGFFITHEDQMDPEDVLPNQDGDQFGAALAVGKFNSDLFDELLVGAPGKAETPGPKSGTVSVFPGSDVGITTGVFFTQKGNGGRAEEGDLFGAALTVGDFNGDLLDDSAVGTPWEALGAEPRSGSVSIAGYGEINFILQ